MLRQRKIDKKHQEELDKTLHRHEKDHFLGPFVGLNPEYMEMSESLHTHAPTHTYRRINICLYSLLVLLALFHTQHHKNCIVITYSDYELLNSCCPQLLIETSKHS